MKLTGNIRTIMLCVALFCMGTAAIQAQQNRPNNDNITSGIEKSPGYYEDNVRSYFKKGQWAAGKRLLDEGMRKYGYLSALNELMGQYFYQYKQYDKARFYLINSLKDDNSNHQAREILVKVEEETKNYSSAIVYVNELLEVSPYSETWWRKKIALYRYMGNDDEADLLLERLRSIYPESERIKNDYNYRMETRYRKQHKSGDAQSQIQSLRELIQLNPNDYEYYLALSNLLLQTGHDAEAAEVAGEGVAMTNNPSVLIEKKVGILAGMNRYNEAYAYLTSLKQTQHAGIAESLMKGMSMDAARSSQMYDPYIQYAKAYDREKNDEALTFLLNTSMARGYYDDALVYIDEAKKRYGQKPELLYKEYLVNRRLGNVTRANNLLVKLYETNPGNEEIATELARINSDKAQELMRFEQYDDAIPLLQMASAETVDPDLRKASMLRLFNCYLQSKKYDLALSTLDNYNELFNYNAYLQQKARIYSEQGKTTIALGLLREGYQYANDSLKSAYASAYEEIATPHIKSLINAGMLVIADTQIREAIDICPNSNDILRMGITAAQLQNKNDDAIAYVKKGREYFPEDPFFIVKEAQTFQDAGDYRKALDIVYPLLEVYMGDSAVLGTYATNCQLLGLKYLKDKEYDKALAVVDSALAFWPKHNDLMLVKGLIYKNQREWDDAYEYLKQYKPSPDEMMSHKRLVNDVMNKRFHNVLNFEYQQARLGNSDDLTASAFMNYTRKYRDNEYTAIFNYLGRDGVAAKKGITDLTAGGTGVQLGAQWKHQINKKLAAYIQGAWGNKYFPQFTVKAGATYDFPHDWNVNVDLSWRNVSSYEGVYGWFPTTDDPQTGSSPEYERLGWHKNRNSLFMATLGVTKTLDQFVLMVGGDGFLLKNKVYGSAKAKMQFFPVEGEHSHLFASAGVGTAPESSLIDRSMPTAFDHLNTFLSFGGYYSFNQHVGFSLAGSWYTMFTQSEELLTGILETEPRIAVSYNNIFYINASVVISF